MMFYSHMKKKMEYSIFIAQLFLGILVFAKLTYLNSSKQIIKNVPKLLHRLRIFPPNVLNSAN